MSVDDVVMAERPEDSSSMEIPPSVPISPGPPRSPAPLTRRVVTAITALALVSVLVAFAAGIRPGDDSAEVATGAQTAAPSPADDPGPARQAPDSPAPSAYFNLEGKLPSAFPANKLGLGFLTLDQPISRAIAVLGLPAATEPDLFGSARSWQLPSEARLAVSAWDDTQEINGLHAAVPSGSPVRIGAYGGVVIGVSTLREVVAAWGPGFASATSPYDDFVVSYTECVGPYPVVVKFDQAAATGKQFAPRAGSPLWNAPVTSVLIAYADDPPGSGGCPSLQP